MARRMSANARKVICAHFFPFLYMFWIEVHVTKRISSHALLLPPLFTEASVMLNSAPGPLRFCLPVCRVGML